MDEAILIEISKRFRKLEDFIQQAIVHVKASETRAEEKSARWHKDNGDMEPSGRSMRELAKLDDEMSDAEDLRLDIDKQAEACRDDLVLMQEAIRAR